MNWLYPETMIPFRFDSDFPVRLREEEDIDLGYRLREFSPFSNSHGAAEIPQPIDELSQRAIVVTYSERYRNIGTSGFVFTRLNTTESILIVNPRNASNFALEGRMFYANFFNTHNTYFATSVQVWDANQHNIYLPDSRRRIFETTIQMTIDVGTFLPRTVMDVVLGEFERLGLEEMANNRFPLFRIPNPEDVFALLPTVILNIDPQSGGVIALNPTDYLEHVYEDDDVYQLRITGHFFDEIWLGRHMLNTLTVHVDNANGRIGFGDALFDDTSV